MFSINASLREHLRWRLGLLCTFLFALLASCSGAELEEETLYLTWCGAPATSMTVQWVSRPANQSTIVRYRLKEEGDEWLTVVGEALPFPYKAPYTLHRVTLSDLQPDTVYTFRVPPYPQDHHFRTAPAELTEPLSFVVGGDMYHDGPSLMAKTCQVAARTHPLFALIGGDIAYAVKAVDQDIGRWIEWIKIWHAAMVTSEGRLIPVIAAIGNHDLIGQYNQTPAQAAVFSALFPMPGERVYNVLDFPPYLSLFLLDSGHANPIAGKQAAWLKEALNARQAVRHRLAVYHVPAYPSVRHGQTRQSVAIRRAWIPLFEKGGIQAAFEHHDHAYKRTDPLRQGRPHPQGVVYLGDGAWGVAAPRPPQAKRRYLAKSAAVRHFIAVTLTPATQSFRCISDQGELIDEYVRTLPKAWEIKPHAPLPLRSPQGQSSGSAS